jgi:hypothetical protein
MVFSTRIRRICRSLPGGTEGVSSGSSSEGFYLSVSDSEGSYDRPDSITCEYASICSSALLADVFSMEPRILFGVRLSSIRTDKEFCREGHL